MPYGDIDGNGTADFPGYMVNAAQGKTGTNTLTVNDYCRRIATTLNYDCQQADINLDGKIDPFNYQNGYLNIDYSGDALGYVQTNIAIAAKATGEDRGDSIRALQDINGDGWPDAVVYRHNPSSTAQLEIFVHSMDASAPYAATGEILHSFDSEVVNTKRVLKENATFAGDFDGNGLADLVITQMNGPLLAAMPMGQPRTIKHNHSTPETLSFVDSPAPASPVYDGNGQFSFFSYFIDINGDGLTDVLGWKDRLKAMALTALTTPNIPTQARYIMCKAEALPASAP